MMFFVVADEGFAAPSADSTPHSSDLCALSFASSKGSDAAPPAPARQTGNPAAGNRPSAGRQTASLRTAGRQAAALNGKLPMTPSKKGFNAAGKTDARGGNPDHSGGSSLVNQLMGSVPEGESPYLTAEEEKQAILQYQETGDPEVLTKILRSVVLLLQKTVLEVVFYRLHETWLAEDLLQEALIMAIKALDSYDTAMGVRFSTYLLNKGFFKGMLISRRMQMSSVVRKPLRDREDPLHIIHFEDIPPSAAALDTERSWEEILGRFLSPEEPSMILERSEQIQSFYKALESMDPPLSDLEREIIEILLSDPEKSDWEEWMENRSLSSSRLKNLRRSLLRKLRNFFLFRTDIPL